MDRMRAMEYFVRVVEAGSFAAAARELDVSPPAVTQLIAALERELGVPLLRRNSRRINLTPDGELFLPACASALVELRAAVARLSRNQARASGKLLVGMARIVGQYVAPFLADFLARHPGITLDLRVAQNLNTPLAGLVDVLAFVGWPEDTDMVAKRIAQTKFITCASPAYWRARGVPRDPEELRGHDCLAFRTPWDVVLDLWKYQRGDDVRSVPIEPRIVANDRDWIIEAAVRGAGVVRMADITTRQIVEGGLLEPALADWEALEAPPIYLMYRRRPSARVRAFVDFLAQLFANLEASRPGAGQAKLAPVPMPAYFRGKWIGSLSRRERTSKVGRPKKHITAAAGLE
jgi:LysR family transcriptional regulator for bpeEF and oprC